MHLTSLWVTTLNQQCQLETYTIMSDIRCVTKRVLIIRIILVCWIITLVPGQTRIEESTLCLQDRYRSTDLDMLTFVCEKLGCAYCYRVCSHFFLVRTWSSLKHEFPPIPNNRTLSAQTRQEHSRTRKYKFQ